jgi:lipopolysaccharide transport system permease protein
MNNAVLKSADSKLDDSRPIKIICATQSLPDLLCSGIASLLSNKNLIFEMILLRLKVRYRQSLLGWAWAILPPLLLTITYTLIFAKITHLDSGDLPYGLFVFAGLVPWTFFSSSVSTATAGIIVHRYLISRVAFPREIIPLSYVATALVDLGVGILMLLTMMWYFGLSLTGTALYVLPVIGVLVVWSMAIALCSSAVQARVRDIGVAMPLLLQVLMFTTPVVYSSDAIPHNLRSIYFLNPLAVLVETFRQAAVLGVSPDGRDVVYTAVVSIVCLVFSYIIFKRLDATLADVI